MFQALSPDGRRLVEPFPDEFLLLGMYRDMVMARVLDSWLMKLQRMGKVAIHAPSVGQEAVGVGTAYALEDGDWVFPLYRELPVYVARKIPVREIVNRYLANSEDPLKGSDFAIYGNKAHRIVPAPIAVGLNISLAVGFSLAFKIRRSDAVVLNYFGDGATSKGEFHEALNFAGVFKAPVVFICTNNMYAISTHVSRQTAAETIADKAVAYGIEGVRVDGNDVVACFLAAKKAMEKARRCDGPTLIEAVTYRVGPHTTADDPSRYRDDEEVSGWKAKDPITRMKKLLVARGLWRHEDDEKLWKTCEEQIKAVLEECEKIPPLHPSVIFENVYGVEPWHLQEQKQDYSQQL